MRLINTKTLKLEEFQNPIPTYAILSHTWGSEEVSFVEWEDKWFEAKKKAGFDKIQKACHQAIVDGYNYLWCDTNCIDKRSSAELSEAINSMFSWYKNSAVCYAYLADVPPDDQSSFSSSRWFTRGWTLQELLAPSSLIFFANDWSLFGTRSSLSDGIFEITKIDEVYTGDNIHDASISERMSWVSHRETTRVEDIAYCMLGIFDINMPLLYGEGTKAFIRLQEEIIRVSNDQSIFCWEWNEDHVIRNWPSMLSPSPKTFQNAGSYHKAPGANDSIPYSVSNSGLSISLRLLYIAYTREYWPSTVCRNHDSQGHRHLAVLDVVCGKAKERVGIVLEKLPLSKRFARFPFPPQPTPISNAGGLPLSSMYVAGPRDHGLLIKQSSLPMKTPKYGVFVTVSCPTNISAISTIPRVDEGCWTHALHPFTPAFLGIVFAEKVVVDSPSGEPFPDSITVFCFVGVKDPTSFERCYCKVLEVQRAAGASYAVEDRISYHESKIRTSVRSSGFPSGESSPSRSDFMSMSNKDVWLHSGLWVRVSDSSRVSVAHISVAHIAILTGPPLPFPSKENGSYTYLP